MRNLKKILALVLALIMSLSLMATAGATDFSDDGNVSDTYRQAVEVLSELGVFNGDQNGQFNPDQPIKRSEVAAILYRIATGDIGLEGNKTYAPYNQFPDVTAEDWYAGYVTYCANAGYIKGRNTGKFDANDNVTGYEVLAMILRAVGYDKNNEFVGSDWQLHTASLAREKGVLRNVLEDPNVQLSQPATREVVAELLFRASLLPQVSWNAPTLSYVESGETLAYENLKVEAVTGVVVANHLADLDNLWISLDEGETRLSTGNVLDVETGLEDIGESRTAYIQNGTHVLAGLEDTGKNNVYDNEGAPVSSLGNSRNGVAITNAADHYINYSKDGRLYSAWRIEYSVTFDKTATIGSVSAEEWFEDKYYDVSDEIKNTNALDVVDTTTDPDKITYTRVIPATDTISWADVEIMQGIFAVADNDTNTSLGIDGYVFAGTNSANSVDRNTDLSDIMTFYTFYYEYLWSEADTTVTGADRGEWLKIIDNNDDNVADYVLLLTYELDEVIGYNTRTEAYTLQAAHAEDEGRTKNIDLSDYAYDYVPVPMEGYEFAVGDKVITARIDGQLLTWEAETQVSTIKTYNYRPIGSETVVTTEDETLYQSGIENDTLYADQIEGMNYGVEYNLYFDRYHNIRAWTPVDSSKHYALLTDMWIENQNNTNYVRNQIAYVELTYGQDGAKVPTDEYLVSNHSYEVPNPFFGVNQEAGRDGRGTDWLQRAIAHLNMWYDDGSTNGAWWSEPSYTDASQNSFIGEEFDYDLDINSRDNTYNITDGNTITAAEGIQPSRTNVAKYTFGEDKTVALESVSEYATDLKGEYLYYVTYGTGSARKTEVMTESDAYDVAGGTDSAWYAALDANDTKTNVIILPVYAVDYVMLDSTKAITAKQTRYDTDDQYEGIGWTNGHVNAVNDTEFYLVTPSNIYYQVGRNNIPAISADKIASMYAVASITNVDSYEQQYWVADVIVIELVDELDNLYSHVFLNLWDSYRDSSRAVIHQLNGFDGQTGEFTTAIIENSWFRSEMPAGFYVLSDDATVDDDGVITAKEAVLVTTLGDYNDWGIYSGTIDRVEKDYTRGNYIEVLNGPKGGDRYTVELSSTTPWYGVYQRSSTNNTIIDWDQLIESEYNSTKSNGHNIIWVTYGGKVVFVVDTDFEPNAQTYASEKMKAIAEAIQLEQKGLDKWTISAKVVDADGNELKHATVKLYDENNKVITSVKRENVKEEGASLTLTAVVTGITDAGITDVASANENAVAVWNGSAKTITVSGIKGNVTLEIEANAATKNLTLTGASYGANWTEGSDYSDLYKQVVSVDGVALATTGTDDVSNVKVEVGATVVITVDANQVPTLIAGADGATVPNFSVVKTNKDADLAGCDVYTITFTMPDKDVNVKLAPKSDVTVSSGTPSLFDVEVTSVIGETINGVTIQVTRNDGKNMTAGEKWVIDSIVVDGTTYTNAWTALTGAQLSANTFTLTLVGNVKVTESIVVNAHTEYATRTVTMTIDATGAVKALTSAENGGNGEVAEVRGTPIATYTATGSKGGTVKVDTTAAVPNDGENVVTFTVPMNEDLYLDFNTADLVAKIESVVTPLSNKRLTVPAGTENVAITIEAPTSTSIANVNVTVTSGLITGSSDTVQFFYSDGTNSGSPTAGGSGSATVTVMPNKVITKVVLTLNSALDTDTVHEVKIGSTVATVNGTKKELTFDLKAADQITVTESSKTVTITKVDKIAYEVAYTGLAAGDTVTLTVDGRPVTGTNGTNKSTFNLAPGAKITGLSIEFDSAKTGQASDDAVVKGGVNMDIDATEIPGTVTPDTSDANDAAGIEFDLDITVGKATTLTVTLS